MAYFHMFLIQKSVCVLLENQLRGRGLCGYHRLLDYIAIKNIYFFDTSFFPPKDNIL